MTDQLHPAAFFAASANNPRFIPGRHACGDPAIDKSDDNLFLVRRYQLGAFQGTYANIGESAAGIGFSAQGIKFFTSGIGDASTDTGYPLPTDAKQTAAHTNVGKAGAITDKETDFEVHGISVGIGKPFVNSSGTRVYLENLDSAMASLFDGVFSATALQYYSGTNDREQFLLGKIADWRDVLAPAFAGPANGNTMMPNLFPMTRARIIARGGSDATDRFRIEAQLLQAFTAMIDKQAAAGQGLVSGTSKIYVPIEVSLYGSNIASV